MSAEIRGMKTWSKLAKNKRRPSEYEIVTTNLQTRNRNREQAYELSPAPDLAMNEWYRVNVFDSPLEHSDWEEFRDPDELIYRVYTRNQDVQEDYIDGLLNDYNDTDHDENLDSQWLDTLELLYTPRRYLQAALQMGAAYFLQVAPASTLTACGGFQEGDEFRWLQRLAYRTRELAQAHPDRGFANREREHWEQHAPLQGFRELMEKVLVAYDWGENFVAMNLVAKPAADETLRQLGQVARRFNDPLTALLADNQMRDSERSRRWSAGLVKFALSKDTNAAVISDWIEKWRPLARRAIEQYSEALPEQDDAADKAIANMEAFHRSLGLES